MGPKQMVKERQQTDTPGVALIKQGRKRLSATAANLQI